MSRNALGKREGQFVRVTAFIERYGTSPTGSTYLLTQVRDAETREMLSDHLWLPGGELGRLDSFRPGDTIRFTARVERYAKGSLGDPLSHRVVERPGPSLDLSLVDQTDAEIIEFGPEARMMADGSVKGGGPK
jgi:hypothetical protein